MLTGLCVWIEYRNRNRGGENIEFFAGLRFLAH